MLARSARTVSRELYCEKRVYIGLTSYGYPRVLRQYFASVENLSSCFLPSAYGIEDENTIIYIAWKMTTSKRHKLVHKICGHGYYKKGIYVYVIRSTARRYFYSINLRWLNLDWLNLKSHFLSEMFSTLRLSVMPLFS